jgi:cysteinyl-tRNA synthetase
MYVYNTFSAKKEVFKPLREMKAGMYVCGPTVYDFAHLGHGRSAVSFDVIRRYLIYKGYEVTYVSNFTDIDDKMINRAEMMKISVKELADRIIPEYAKDYKALGILVPDAQPKATEYVPQMIDIIKKLEKNGATYVLDDGVYFDISKFPAYGKLSKQDLDALKSGIRVEVKVSKKNPQDFVLWKFSKPGEPEWESPWGKGRPGWHIECSAMSREFLGESFDIHGGGADLTFPHHECEIAQSECASGKIFVKYWLHNGFIQINNEKMSKSLGNFFLLKDVFAKFSPQAVRYLFLQTHYRAPIEFTDDLLSQARNSLARLQDFMVRLEKYVPEVPNVGQKDFEALIVSTKKRFEDAMDDDFETSQALAALFDFVKQVNRRIDSKTLTRESQEAAMTFLTRVDTVLGILVSTQNDEIDPETADLLRQREESRKNRDWKASDHLRGELLKRGIQVEDGPKGTVWKKI